jgi:hypothetical protein
VTGTRPWRRAALALAVAALCAACGTTVSDSAARSAANSDGVGGTGPANGPSQAASGLGASGAANPSLAGGAGGPVAGTGAGVGNSSGQEPGSAGTAAGPDRSPLTIGLTYIDNSGSTAALGASTSQTASQKSVAEALVRGLNAAGGIAGRKINAIEYSFNAQDSDYSTDAATACASFTQDHHVSLVLDTAFGIIGGFRDCLQRAGVVDITTQDEGDKTSSAGAFLHVNTVSMNVDRQYAAVLVGMTATGYLGKANQLGVIVEGCAEGNNAYAHTLLPLIKRLGLKAPKEEQIACTTGFASAGPAAPAINNAILAFRQAGVDRVMFVSYNEAVILLLFGNDADSQRYYPGYLLSSGSAAQALRTNIPSGQWPQLHGVGNQPYVDVDGGKPTTVDKRCDALVRAGGVTPASYQDEGFVVFECAPFLLLESALTKTNGQSTAHDVMTAINALGSSFVAPGIVSGTTSFTSTKHDGPDMVQVFGYVASCSCMRYSGSPQPAPA